MMSRGRKRFLIGLAVLAFLVIVVYLVLPRVVDLNRYRDAISANIEEATGGKAKLDHISWGIAGGLWLELKGLTVQDATVVPGDIELPRVFATVSIFPLLKKQIIVQELRLERPALAIRLPPHPVTKGEAGQPSAHTTTNGIPSQGLTPSSDESPLPVTFAIQHIEATQGRVTLHDPVVSGSGAPVHSLDEVDIKISNFAPGEPITFQVALRDAVKPGLGSLTARGSFSGLTDALTIVDPKLELTATLQEFAAKVIAPYLSDRPLAHSLDGSVSLDLHYTGDLGQRFDAKGHIDLGKLTYTDASLWKEPLPGLPTKLTYELRLDGDRINLTQVDLALGNIAISGQALIEDWRKQPTVRHAALKGRLPVADLKRLMPYGVLGKDEEIVSQLLAGGGEIVVEQLTAPDLTPARLSSEAAEWIEELDATLTLSGISLRPSAAWPKLTDIAGRLKLHKGELSASDVRGLLGPLTLPALELHASSLMAKPRISAIAKGPLKLIATADASLEQLLKRYGLRHLAGDATIDMKAHYDAGNPARWDAAGSLVLEGIQAETEPDGVRLEDLQGRLSLKRAEALDISVERLTGRVNQSPIEIDGKIIDAGTRAMVLEGRAKAESLDLGHFATLLPVLKAYQVGGKLDMDVQMHYTRAQPVNTQMTGKIHSRGLALRWQDFVVDKGDADIALSGQTVDVKETTFRINDQALQLSGQLTGLHEPKVRLHMRSANLNVDRLLAPAKAASQTPPEAPSETSALPEQPKHKVDSTRPGAAAVRDARRSELPPLVRQLVANIVAELTEGQYRNQAFQDLRLQVDYDQGVIKNHAFDVRIGGGQVTTQGPVDLRNLKRISFNVTPDIKAVPLESITQLFDLDQVLLHGPLTLAGHLRGRAGGTKEELLTSLSGNLEANVGPGRIQSETSVGDALFNLLSFIHADGILSGKARDGFAQGGIPYDNLNVKAEFQDGRLKVDRLKVVTPALNVDGTGDVDLVHQRLKMKVDLAVLETVDEVLGFVPLVGKAARDMTEVHLDVEGSVEKPQMNIRPGAGLVEGVEDEVKEVGRHLKSLFKRHSDKHDKKTTE